MDEEQAQILERPVLTYRKYLNLDHVLGKVTMLSTKHGAPVHEEHLFIEIHQIIELWFQQIICEFDSVRGLFHAPNFGRRELGTIVQRLRRVVLVWKLIIAQLDILETITPMEFLEFRDHLFPASGFDSLQFRLIEHKLGLKWSSHGNQQHILGVFHGAERAALEESISGREQSDSICELLIKYLETFVTQHAGNVDFAEATAKYLQDQVAQGAKVEEIQKKRTFFGDMLDAEKHERKMQTKERRFTHKAFLGALLVCSYSHDAQFHQSHELLNVLIDIDSLMMKWRFGHMMTVQRFLGSAKCGTGGTDGYLYLRASISNERFKVFLDLLNVSSFLLPRKYLPDLTAQKIQSNVIAQFG